MTDNRRFVLCSVGFAALVAGCYAAWPPLSGIVAGVLMMGAAFASHYFASEEKPKNTEQER